MREKGGCIWRRWSTWTRSAATASGSGYRRSWTRTRRCGPPVGSHRENRGQRIFRRGRGLRRCLLHRRYRRSRRRAGAALQAGPWAASRLIQDFIEDELADRRAYLAYAACAPNVAARRLLRQLAGEEGSHARRLMGVYYLVTGCCYQPRLQGGRVESLPWREVLRTRYHAETCGGLRYAQAAEATEDVCLREIWEELSAAEYRHARQLLSLLEQMVLA